MHLRTCFSHWMMFCLSAGSMSLSRFLFLASAPYLIPFKWTAITSQLQGQRQSCAGEVDKNGLGRIAPLTPDLSHFSLLVETLSHTPLSKRKSICLRQVQNQSHSLKREGANTLLRVLAQPRRVKLEGLLSLLSKKFHGKERKVGNS